MKIIFTTLAILNVILSLVFSILPFGNLAFIPIILGMLFSFLAMKAFKKEEKSTGLIKVLFLGIIVALALNIYRAVFTENVVVETEQSIEKEKQSEEDAIKELENIELDN